MNRLIKLMLAASSGVMLSLSWLGFPGWLLFAAFLPLLLLDDHYISHPARFGSFRFWGYSFLSFLIWNSVTTWWIVHATIVGAFLAIVANSFLMSVFFLTAHILHRHAGKVIGYLAFVVIWLSFEFSHFHWDIEWPWLILGNGFANNVRLVQWYSITGTLGGSLWIWMVNILLFVLLRQLAVKEKRSKVLYTGAVTVFTIFIPSVISFIQYNLYAEAKNPRKVLIIQPNIDPYSETFDEGATNDKLNKFIRLTETAMQPDIQYIVGPETVFEQNWNEENLASYPAVSRLQELLKTGNNSSLVIGASTFRLYRDKDKATSTARHTRDGLYYDVYNTAIFVDSSRTLQTYHKSILVPGVEKMPFRKYLRFLDSFIINLGGTTGTLGIQSEPTNFVAKNGDQIAPAICYESVFGGYMAEFVKKGAHVIFIITNDGWWKNTPGYRQHFSFARLRAIETRRWVVRSANTGISGFINQRGDIVQHSRWWVDATLIGNVNFNDSFTFYVKHGDYIGRIAGCISIILILAVSIFGLVKKIKKPHQF
jgi:apolipoprotein N-acyltransferase